MKRVCFALVLFSLALAGCSNTIDSGSGTTTPAAGGAKGGTDAAASAGDEQSGGGSGSDTAAAAGSDVALTPENTKIKFVGAHVDKTKPDNNGWFEGLKGTAKVDGDKLQSVEVEIDTTSINTEHEDLTKHLKTADFFDVNTHPIATFKSTAIEDAGDGKVNITGDLTMLGETKSITFPATVSTDGGLTLGSDFTIDRTEFGMNFGVENVEKEVKMTVTVGK